MLGKAGYWILGLVEIILFSTVTKEPIIILKKSFTIISKITTIMLTIILIKNPPRYITGRHYKIFTYKGVPDAEHVIVMMGSGCCVVDEYLASEFCNGKKYGIVHVKLFRPWDSQAFMDALPKTVKTVSVLDRTKESGTVGEPLYMDVATTLQVGKGDFLGEKGFCDGAVYLS